MLSCQLAVKLGDGSSHISYTLLATLKRPFVPAPLAPEDTREISVVEKIDVSNPEYDHPVPEQDDQVMVDGTTLTVGIPKAAFVRGDIMPVSIKVQCAEDFGKADAIRVALVRRFHLFGKGRRELLGEENAREPIYRDLIANSDNDHSYESTIKMFIPPASPPTTGSSGRILRVEYIVQVSVDMNLARKNDGDWKSSLVVQKELPVIIGTTPRADISIDDEDDEEVCEETTANKVINGNAASPESPIDNDTNDDTSKHDESATNSDQKETPKEQHDQRQHSMSSLQDESHHQQSPMDDDIVNPAQNNHHHMAEPPFEQQQQQPVCQSPASFSHHSSSSPYLSTATATHPSFDYSPPPPQHVSTTATHCFPPEPRMSSYSEHQHQPFHSPPPPPPSSVGHFPSPATTPFMPMPEPIPIHHQQHPPPPPSMSMMPVPESYTSHSPSYPPPSFPSPTPPGYSHLTHKSSHESWTMPTPYQHP